MQNMTDKLLLRICYNMKSTIMKDDSETEYKKIGGEEARYQ